MPARREPDERPSPLLRVMGLAFQQLADDLHRRLADAGFDDQRRADDAAMAHIPPEGIRLTALAERAGVTKQAMAEVVDSLVARDYLERTADPTDGRAKLIVFGERGWRSVDAALDALAVIEAELAASVGEHRIRALRRTLELVLEAGTEERTG